MRGRKEGAQRNGRKLVKNILGPSVAAMACQFPKNGGDVVTCLVYQKTHNLCPIRGDSYDDQPMTSTSFLKQALLVADIHAAHALAQHGDVPDKHPPRSMAT
jgi:hypothetical protein